MTEVSGGPGNALAGQLAVLALLTAPGRVSVLLSLH